MFARRFRSLAVCALMLCSAPSVVGAELPNDTATYIQRALDDGRYVGMIVGFIDGEDSVIRGFGVASKETGKAPDENTVFEIGSITKTFTATLLAAEVLANRMKLADPVQKYLPAGTTLFQVGDRPITLEDLATHRSGLPRMPAGFAPANPSDPYADFDVEKLWQAVDSVRPGRAPGVAAEYSNFGFAILGQVLARETGMSYRDLLDDRIFTPLGMTHSDTQLTAALERNAAQGYGPNGEPTPHWTLTGFAGAGAINSTATDMLSYIRANMRAAMAANGPAPNANGSNAPSGSNARAAPSTSTSTSTSAIGATDRTLLSRAMSLAQEPRADMTPDGMRIGLAWLTTPSGTGHWHNGGTGGFRSFAGFTNDGKRGVVILSNTGGPSVDAIGLHLLDGAAPLPPTFQETTLAPEKLDEYVGTYAVSPQLRFTVTRDGPTIAVQLTGQPAAPVFAYAPDQFFSKIVDAQFTFERSAGGKVIGLTLHQNGQNIHAERLGANGEPIASADQIELPREQLDDYVGRYRLGPTAVLSIGARRLARLRCADKAYTRRDINRTCRPCANTVHPARRRVRPGSTRTADRCRDIRPNRSGHGCRRRESTLQPSFG
jgi:CubicO group peptidase (beta-lactamase class C family)